MYNEEEFPTGGWTSFGESRFEENFMHLLAIRASATSPSPAPAPVSGSYSNLGYDNAMKISGRESIDSSGYGSGVTTPIGRIHSPETPMFSPTGSDGDGHFSVWSDGPSFEVSSPNVSGEATPTPKAFGFSLATPPSFPMSSATAGNMGNIGHGSCMNDQRVQLISITPSNPQWNKCSVPPPHKITASLGNKENAATVNLGEADVSPEKRVSSYEKKMMAEMLKALQDGKRTKIPPIGYVCHICYKKEDHMIGDCPKKHSGDSLTPYQGPKQCYGEFHCGRCHRKWKSCKSWANMCERCNKCKPVGKFLNENYPTRQFPLEHAGRLGLVAKDSRGEWRCVAAKKTIPGVQPVYTTSTSVVSSPLVNIGTWPSSGHLQGHYEVGGQATWGPIGQWNAPVGRRCGAVGNICATSACACT